MKKMLVTINDPPYGIIRQMANRRGITVQMMLRSIIIPQWLEERTGQIVNENPRPDMVEAETPNRQASGQGM